MLLYPASSEAAHIASQGCAMSARYFSAMRTINCLTSRQGFDGVASENLVHLTRGRQRAHRQLQLGQQRFGAPEIRGFQAFGELIVNRLHQLQSFRTATLVLPKTR
jgi:hypothetical protein